MIYHGSLDWRMGFFLYLHGLSQMTTSSWSKAMTELIQDFLSSWCFSHKREGLVWTILYSQNGKTSTLSRFLNIAFNICLLFPICYNWYMVNPWVLGYSILPKSSYWEILFTSHYYIIYSNPLYTSIFKIYLGPTKQELVPSQTH